jgi:outer membrane protein assembly factor BamB
MDSTATSSARWYESVPVLVLASLVFPPLGLALLWARPNTEAYKKVIGSLAIVVIAGVYASIIFGGRVLFVGKPEDEAHYEELERHRAEQKQEPPRSATSAADEKGSSVVASGTLGTAAPAAPAAPVATSSRDYWTEFRGLGRNGRYDETPILTNWPQDGLKLLWRQPIGGGYASFSIAEGRAFTIEKRRAREVVAAYDLETGRELWIYSWDGEFIEERGDGPRATPTWEDGRLYALGGTGELHSVDARNGKRIWSRDILKDNGAQNLPWGMAASPLVVDDKVVVLPGGSRGNSVVAYNKLTGEPVWKSLNDRAAYSSPMLVTLAGIRQVLAVTATRVVGLDPQNGELLWSHPWDTQMGINVSQPIVVDPNRFFISSGYGKGAALIEINGSNGSLSARAVWEKSVKAMNNKFNSSVLHEGHAYGLDEGILACVDVETGEQKWKGGRYGYGQVLLASGHLIVMTETGELVLLKATPDRHQEVARFNALQDRCWNYPALANGRLLVRNQTQMACYDISAR